MSLLHESTDRREGLPLSRYSRSSPTPTCPYSIQLLYSNASSSTYVIREKDVFGEYPNIYAKVYFKNPTRLPLVIILSDTGTGRNQKNEGHEKDFSNALRLPSSPQYWNIATFLSTVLNPGHDAPYVVLTTHCHFDHICGIQHFLDANVNLTVLASSNDIGFLTPWRALQKHSLCELLDLKAPKYDARWVEDAQRIVVGGLSLPPDRFSTSIRVIHTPGHTPDSMSWYDDDSHTLCVGDSFYEKESDETRSGSGGQWKREPPQPVIFTNESNIIQWNASMHRLVDFVRYENRKLGTDNSRPLVSYKQDGLGYAVDFEELSTFDDDWSEIKTVPSRRRVVLCASHVTIGTDAEFALLDMLAFMLRVELDQVPRMKVPDLQDGQDAWLWDDALGDGHVHDYQYQYSVRAPWSIIHRTTG